MISTFTIYVILCVLTLFFTLCFGYYWNILRKTRRCNVYHILPHVIYYILTRSKDSKFSNFLFQVLEDMYKKYAKEGFCMSYDIYPTLYIFSEEPIKKFFNEKSAIDKSIHYNLLADVIGHGLVTSNGKRWKNHRKLINPVFQLGILKDKVSLFNEHALALIEELKTLKDKSSPDLTQIIKRHYFNALSESIFGLKQNEENKVLIQNYFQAIDKMSEIIMYRTYQPWLWPKFVLKFLPFGRKYLKVTNEIYNFINTVILEMKKHDDATKETNDIEYFSKSFKKSFTYLLLQHSLKDPSFTFEDLHAEVGTVMAAGYDTVSYTTLWCLFMLGLHPEIQEKAFQEVQSLSENYVTYEDMNNFTYLEAVIMESLRLYPTIPLYGRLLTEDIQLGKSIVHKGTAILFSVYFWHRNPDIYPDPETFDPERFLNFKERKPWLHIPFAEGNRACIGKKYALIEMKIFLAHILHNFKITSLDKREDIKLCYTIVLTPSKPLRLLITPR